MSLAAVIRRMADAGASPEAIAIAVEAIEAEQAKDAARRAKRAEQKRQERDRRATVARQGCDNAATPPSDKEKSPAPPKEITSPRSDPKGSSLTPRAELETVLDAMRAGAVLDHRKKIGKPLTAHGAKLLAGKFGQCADPNAAADEMISNGWQGFKPEWLESRKPRTADPPKKLTVGESFRQLARERGILDATGSPNRHLETSDRGREDPGPGIARRFAIAGN